MRIISILLLAMPAFCGIRISGIIRVPAKPGQVVSAMATDSQGNTFVSTTGGVVYKLDPSGNLVFSRELPGISPGERLPMAVDRNGDVYITGRTWPTDSFPFTHRLYTEVPGGGTPVFVVKLSGADGSIVYATAVATGFPGAIAVDAAGRAFVTGSTQEPGFVVTPSAYNFNLTNLSRSNPAFFAALSPAGDAAVFAGRFGGNTAVCVGGTACVGVFASVRPGAIAFDASGNIYIAGETNVGDLPVTPGALATRCGCGNSLGDGFVAKFSPDGSTLLYATYFGSVPADPRSSIGTDTIESLAVDTLGDVWVAGRTNGTNFPVTSDAPQKQHAGAYDAFFARINPSRGALLFSTYLGGDGDDEIATLAQSADGRLLLSGSSDSATLPGTFTGFPQGPGFLAVFDPAARAIVDGSRFVNGVGGTAVAVLPGGIQLAGTAQTMVPDVRIPIAVTSSVLTRIQFTASVAPNLGAVANAAGYAASASVAPGELIALYGAALGPETAAAAEFQDGRAPLSLGGVQVLIDGAPVPLLYAQDGQVNAIVPFSVAGRDTVRMVVRNANGDSAEALLQVVEAAPSAFTTWHRHWAAALNQDGSPNGPEEAQKAKWGTIVSVFLTGAGDLAPRPADGELSTDITARHLQPVQVLYQGQPIEITYAGPAPTLVAGVTQVNFRLPDRITTSEPRFTFKAGQWESEPFVVLVKP